MKRLTSILAISVIAVMSAGAARADIASTTYVVDKVTPVSTQANTNASEIKTLKSDKQDKSAMVGSTSDKLDDVNNDTNYPTVAAVYTITTSALGNQVNNKLDKTFTGETDKNKAVITNDDGAITTGTISSDMITDSAVTSAKIKDGTIVNADIADNAAIATSKISGLDAAIAGKQATLNAEQLAAANSGITKAKVGSYDAAVTTANNALPKATYDMQVGTVSAANMGTTATTVVGAIKEIKSAVSATDGAAVKTDQGAANKNKAVITDTNGKVTTGEISSAMITDGTIVNADISASAAIAQSKISGLTDALAGKIPVPTATNDSGLLVLTYNSTTKTYAWENIGR